MKVSKSDRELLLLIRKDDKVAFYNLYERYCNRLYGFVLRYVKLKTDSEEIVQEVFIKIWENRDKIDASKFESFLFTIAHNSIISMFRKRSAEMKYRDYLKSLQKFEDSSDATLNLQINELNNEIQSLLNKLTPRQQEVFHLSRTDGLKHKEIAKKLNISVNTVKKHITNTTTYLKAHLHSCPVLNLFLFLVIL